LSPVIVSGENVSTVHGYIKCMMVRAFSCNSDDN